MKTSDTFGLSRTSGGSFSFSPEYHWILCYLELYTGTLLHLTPSLSVRTNDMTALSTRLNRRISMISLSTVSESFTNLSILYKMPVTALSSVNSSTNLCYTSVTGLWSVLIMQNHSSSWSDTRVFFEYQWHILLCLLENQWHYTIPIRAGDNLLCYCTSDIPFQLSRI